MVADSSDAGMTGADAPSCGHFKRALGLVDATAVVVGSMIGSGIFIVSAETARNVGSPALLLFCWVLAGILTVIAALCYSELASMFPKAGGQYVFLREAFGPLAGFLYGWTFFLVIQTGTIAAVGVAFAKFLGVFLPDVSPAHVLFSIGSWHFSAAQLLSVFVITFLTGLNCRGIETGKSIQTSFTTIKVLALAGLILLGLFSFDKFHGAGINFSQLGFWTSITAAHENPVGLAMLAAVGLAMVGPLFSCDAWNNITFAGEEVKDAERILPRSLALGTLLVVSLYILANIVYLLLLPLHGDPHATTAAARGIMFAAEDRVGTAATEVIFGPPGRWIMAGAIMISTFGCLNGLILAGARVYYAMARDNLFFKNAGVLNRNTNVPVFGLVIQGIWASLLATSGSYSQLLEYVMFATLLFYLATVSALLYLRRRDPSVARPYKVPAYPLFPIFYLVVTAAIMTGQFVLHPVYAGWGLFIVLLGVPVYFFVLKRKAAAE
jgi:APA family basic amino acid/polyamine antiporter